MAKKLLDDIKSDRVSSDGLIDLTILGGERSTAHHRVVRLGSPDVQENRMCAQCVGECKVF